MKAILLLVAAASAVRLSGVDVEELQGGAHWRKPWPQGLDDGGDGEADVLEAFNEPVKYMKKEKPKEKYPWEYDQEVIHTGQSIKQAEGMVGAALTHEAVAAHKGMDMVYDMEGKSFDHEKREDFVPNELK